MDRTAARHPRAHLVRIATRQALNRPRTLARRREDYVGEWRPEPLLTTPDVAEDVEPAGLWAGRAPPCGRSPTGLGNTWPRADPGWW